MSDGLPGDDAAMPDHRNARETLPQRRTGDAVDFTYAGINATFTACFSLYADWRCAEIFLSTDRTQGDIEANVRDAGILASHALQHGATIEQLVAGVTHEEDGSASSIVGKALNLVKQEIDRLRGAPPDAMAVDGPGGPPQQPAGTGGAAAVDGAGAKDVPPTLNRNASDGSDGGRAPARHDVLAPIGPTP